MRYKVFATFKEEQRKGFIVTHQFEKEFDSASDMSSAVDTFLHKYDSRYCHGLNFHVEEQNDCRI